jgi:GNAT superfamily N-acetyltransferase
MFLRTGSRDFNENCAGGGAANRGALKAIVERNDQPGLLAYRDGVAVGWVAVAPREEYGRVMRSPIHKPIDDEGPVYSISCFFVAKGARGEGVADALLEAAMEFARKKGARLIEAYPSDVGATRRPAADMWRGAVGQFERAGFEVAARRKPARPIMRKFL